MLVVKSKYHRNNPFDLTLADAGGCKLVNLYKPQGDFVLRCGSNCFPFFRSALCYISPLMKQLTREFPEQHDYALSSDYSDDMDFLSQLVYRKYCLMWHNDETSFLELLNELKIDYDVLPVHEFFDLNTPEFCDKFKFRVFDEP